MIEEKKSTCITKQERKHEKIVFAHQSFLLPPQKKNVFAETKKVPSSQNGIVIFLLKKRKYKSFHILVCNPSVTLQLEQSAIRAHAEQPIMVWLLIIIKLSYHCFTKSLWLLFLTWKNSNRENYLTQNGEIIRNHTCISSNLFICTTSEILSNRYCYT